MVATATTRREEAPRTGAAPAQTTDAGATPAQQPRATPGQEARTPAAPGTAGPDAPSGTPDVNTALSATPFSAQAVFDQIAQLVRSHAGWPADCFANNAVMTLMVNKLTGEQMHHALQLLNHPPRGANRVWWWTHYVRRAGPPAAATYLGIVAGSSPADLGQLLAPAADADLAGLFAGVTDDPLTLFPALQSGLTAPACASNTFVNAMIARSSGPQIWRAIKGTPATELATLAGKLNASPTGWSFLDSIDGAGATPAERALLTTLHAAANPAAQAKIVTLNATAGVATPGVPFATAFASVQAATPAPTAAALRALMQTATTAERVAVMGDATKAAFVFGILTGHPLVELSVQEAEKGDYMAATPFFDRVWGFASMTWPEKLTLLADRAYVTRLGPRFDANAAAIVTWITTTLPAKASISAPQELDLRAIGLSCTDASIKAAIQTKFADRHYDGSETQTAAASPPEAYQTPLQRLDALLALPAPPAGEVVSMLGALGSLKATVLADTARIDRLRGVLDEERFYQALVDLQMPLKDQLTQLRQKGHTAARLQSVIGAANAMARALALRDDTNVTMVRGDIPNQPIQLFYPGVPLDHNSLDYTAWRTWVVEATAPADLLQRIGGTEALAQAFAPKLDAGSAWGFLTRVAEGPALLPSERTALENLARATGVPATASTLRAKLRVATTPATPAPSGPAPTGPAPTTPTVPTAPLTKAQELDQEIVSPTANATRVTQLSNEVSPTERTTFATTHRARIIALLSMSQLSRFAVTLGVDLVTQLGWLRDKGGAIPTADLQFMLNMATTPHQLALFDDAALTTLVQGSSALGPLQTMRGLTGHLATLATKAPFWTWLFAKGTALDRVVAVGTCGAIPAAIGHITVPVLDAAINALPKGTGLPAEARDACDAIMVALTNEGQLARSLFSVRFDVALTGPWAAAALDDVKLLYNDCKNLPIAQVANNPRLLTFNRRSGGGGTYSSQTNTINIDQTDTNQTENMYAGTPQQVPERYFDHTVRHEVGHAVDAMLGSRTALVFNTAAWKEYGTSSLDTWIGQFNGWTQAGGGTAPTDAEKQQIRDLIMQLLHSGGGAIEGPNMGARDLAPADHPFTRFPTLKVVNVMSRGTGTMKYKDRYNDGGKVFSINYYYRRFMECSAQAAASAPRDYCMFSPAEWFADMYAEFYRQFDGIDDSKLGGNCPGWVKTWMLANVHNIGGRTPHDLRGGAAPMPRGQRVNH
jgi:hypothetical protein